MEASAFIKKEEKKMDVYPHTLRTGSLPSPRPQLTPKLHRRQLHPISINRFMRTNCTGYIAPNAVQRTLLQ